ncbi:aldose 1-epimerase [Polychaeton citri CBS 116435]|uniref:Aldose 1-epimerase n=1 Tax=Polychaeton citri CBS 116435 TaxID=1314669 RepID=A0A9P4Q7Y5_9PEZI|nr:aldose 1-epimerase [Polychaeton citri CBS 116435]
MLRSTTALLLAATASNVFAQTSYSNGSSSSPFPPFTGDPFKKYELQANNIKASFIPYGARLTNLLVPDKYGDLQDVAVGYDDGKQYLNDTLTSHTYFGAVVGRYANRIKNGTFEIDGQTYDIPKNEHNGTNPLHGGFIGYDQRNWTVASYTGNSITFTLYDEAYQGFPGDVLNIATYTLGDDASWTSRMVSIPLNEATPIMLANHVYWNLGAFVNKEAITVLNDTLHMPYADRYVKVDGILIPTGEIGVTSGTCLDFTSPKAIGQDIEESTSGSEANCTGYDNAFILDRPRYSALDDPGLEVLQLHSSATGIQLSLETNQQGLQIYSCIGQNGTVPVKESQQHQSGNTTYVEKYGCIVIETQDWIDGINNPQWGREQWQIFSPTSEPAINYAKYTFSVKD